MNIGIDIRAIGKNRTGDEVYTRELIQGLSQYQSDHRYFLFTDLEDWYTIELLATLPKHMKVITLLPKNKLLWTEILLARACFHYHIDLLHVQYITPFFLPSYTKLITTIHDISWKFVPEYLRQKDVMILNLLIPWSIKRADTVITVSHHSRYGIQSIYDLEKADKVVTIYNGGYISDFPRVTQLSSKVQKILSGEYILYLGSLQPRKNVPSLIKAFALFKKNNPTSTIKCIIAGGKGYNYDSSIEDIITSEGIQRDVVLLGGVSNDEKMVLMKNAKIFIFLSLYEGFGIPIIEAMSMGTPVIAAKSSCLPEVIQDAGILVEPYDIEDIQKNIYILLNNSLEWKKYQDKGYKRAKDFQWETMVATTYAIYKSMLIHSR